MATITSELKKVVQFTQIVKADGKNAVVLSASINSESPSNYPITCNTISPTLYKENRNEIAAIRAEFEDTVWAEQESMEAASAETDEAETTEEGAE